MTASGSEIYRTWYIISRGCTVFNIFEDMLEMEWLGIGEGVICCDIEMCWWRPLGRLAAFQLCFGNRY